MVNLSHAKNSLVTRKGFGAGSEEARQMPSPECSFWPTGWGASDGSAREHHLLCRSNEFGSQVDLMALHSTQLRLSLSLPQASHLLILGLQCSWALALSYPTPDITYTSNSSMLRYKGPHV